MCIQESMEELVLEIGDYQIHSLSAKDYYEKENGDPSTGAVIADSLEESIKYYSLNIIKSVVDTHPTGLATLLNTVNDEKPLFILHAHGDYVEGKGWVCYDLGQEYVVNELISSYSAGAWILWSCNGENVVPETTVPTIYPSVDISIVEANPSVVKFILGDGEIPEPQQQFQIISDIMEACLQCKLSPRLPQPLKEDLRNTYARRIEQTRKTILG